MTTSFLTDVALVMTRELRPVLRDPISIVLGLMQPLVLLALFGPLLTQVPGVSRGSVWQWFVPAVLLMITLFGTSTTGAGLLLEMQTGAHERLLVTPLRRTSLLVGRAMKEVVPLVVQAVIIILVVLPFGLAVDPGGAVLGIVLLGVFGVGVGALSHALALVVRRSDWVFWSVQQMVLFPLLILGGLMLPLDGAPGWMQVAARLNPITYLVAAERSLFLGDLGSAAVLHGAVAAAGTAVLGLTVGVRAMRRATA
jgi:ABC-2 type transport system permease protein